MAMMISEVAKVAAGRHLRQRSSASLLLLDVARTRSQIGHSNGILSPAVLGASADRFRYFSSNNNHSSNFLCSNRARVLLRDLQVNTKDFSRIDYPLDSQALGRLIKEAEEAAEKDFNVDALKELYYSLVRPELVSRLLIHKHPFEHTFTHWLKYQTHVLTGQRPRLTTAYDVMVHLLGLHKDDWVFYLNYLAHERIAVIEEWVSISFTKHLIYNHGLKDFANIHFHKGESDASWHQQSNTADFSGLIWDDQQVISARTHLGVPDCFSSAQSEAKAALAILTEAKDLGIENFVLWSDNKAVCGVISGTKPIDPKDKDWKLFMALRSLRPAFKRLVVMSVPRELLKFADGMLREPSVKLLKTTGVKYPRPWPCFFGVEIFFL